MRLHPVFVALPLCAALSACENRGSSDAPPPGASSASATEAAAKPAAAAATPAGNGTIEGTITVSGKIPPQPKIPTHQGVQRVCGKEVPDFTLQVGDAGALQDAIVFVADAAKQPAPAEATSITLDQKQCSFAPAVIAARAGTELKILNSDPLVHNVRAMQGQDTWVNVAMPLEGMSLKRVLPPAPATFKVHCDVHPWMRGALRTFDHPHFALTAADGKFRLEGVPAGKHRLGVWHPRFGELLLEVDVPASGTVTADASWTAEQLQPR